MPSPYHHSRQATGQSGIKPSPALSDFGAVKSASTARGAAPTCPYGASSSLIPYRNPGRSRPSIWQGLHRHSQQWIFRPTLDPPDATSILHQPCVCLYVPCLHDRFQIIPAYGHYRCRSHLCSEDVPCFPVFRQPLQVGFRDLRQSPDVHVV